MPIYSYMCPACEKIQEVAHSMDQTLRPKCKDCGKQCKKIIDGPRVIIDVADRADTGSLWKK